MGWFSIVAIFCALFSIGLIVVGLGVDFRDLLLRIF